MEIVLLKDVRLAQLQQELASLGLTGFLGLSTRMSVMGVETLIVHAKDIVPSQAQAIQDIIAAHVPQPVLSPDEELDLAIVAASNFAELKAALLGKSRPAKVQGRSP